METPNLENIVFHYCIQSVERVQAVNGDIFDNSYIRAAFRLTKAFISEYATLPFDYSEGGDLSGSQLIEFAHKHKYIAEINRQEKAEVNYRHFQNNLGNLLGYSIKDFSVDYVKQVSDRYIEWNTFLLGLQKTNDFVSSQEPDVKNIPTLISKAKSIFITGTDVEVREEPVFDFWDAESHRVIEENTAKMSTGWRTIDQVLGGGWEKGTLNHFWGSPNTGKCSRTDTLLSLKKKSTGELVTITIGDFFDYIKREKAKLT